MTAAIIWAAINGFFATVVWPFLVAFAGWIMAGAAAVLGLLFSPAIRKYTIAAICVALILGLTWGNGYFAGRAGVKVSCDGFHQIVLKGKNDKSTIAQVREHNNLGEQLGCWSNANIR